MPIRKPAVAGSFYPSDPSRLKQFCQFHLVPEPRQISARAVIVPHAGYEYSGPTACKVFSRIQVPEKNLLLGPNHRGVGQDFALSGAEAWETPLGRIAIDSELNRALLTIPQIKEDSYAHDSEHSLETEVPLIQTRNPNARISALLIGTPDLVEAHEVALACAKILEEIKAPILLTVSNDMSHYEDEKSTRKKDRYALDAIQNLDAPALIKAVKRYGITMCGYVPVYMLLVMANPLGFKKVTLVDYQTSAEATGDTEHVVGYAGFIFE